MNNDLNTFLYINFTYVSNSYVTQEKNLGISLYRVSNFFYFYYIELLLEKPLAPYQQVTIAKMNNCIYNSDIKLLCHSYAMITHDYNQIILVQFDKNKNVILMNPSNINQVYGNEWFIGYKVECSKNGLA